MSKIITSLPVDIDSNNTIKTETKDKDIIYASIKAPDINKNLLTQEYVMNNCDSQGMGDGVFTKKNGYFHYNIGKVSNASGGMLFMLPVYNLNLKPNTKYTFTMKFFNVVNGVEKPHYLVKLFSKGGNKIFEYYVGCVQDKIWSYTFTTPDTSEIYYLSYERWDWDSWKKGSFDLKIISLVEGDIPLLTETENLYSHSKQSVITSNENNSLGTYQVSPYIRKHIQTIEHNIVKQKNQYDINWR